jgi:hypothetical protein
MRAGILIFLAAFALALHPGASRSCNVCGGGTNDVAVLALDGRMLFNFGYTFDHYIGAWDQNGNWTDLAYDINQHKIAGSFAYRLNSHIQFGLSLPYVINTSEHLNLKQSGGGIGDLSLTARYELFHEFQLKKIGKKKKIDDIYPYLAFTFGLILPTGKSDEIAENEVDLTGKGYYTTSLGISIIKSIVKNQLQLSADFSWQHNFENKYETYFGGPPAFDSKQAGDKFNYSLTANYIFGSEHAVSLTASGFSQGSYILDEQVASNSDERVVNFAFAYTYYPHVQFRVTPSVKWTLPTDNFGRNAPGSTTFNINFTYYIPDYSIK